MPTSTITSKGQTTWPGAINGLGDAAIVAVATMSRCDAVATFDRKFANKLETFGLASYF